MRSDHPSDNSISHLSTSPRHDEAHRAFLLNRGDDALLLRAHLLRHAQRCVSIQTFIWKNDECGRYFAFLILEAAKRGVRTKILVDCWPGLDYPPLLVFLGAAHPLVEVKFYNPPAEMISPTYSDVVAEAITQFDALSHRMHNKTFIVDERMMIVGGRNYENAYYDRGSLRNFKDREIVLEGPAVRQGLDSMVQYWSSPLAFFGRDLRDYDAELEKSEYSVDSSRESFELGDLFDDLEQRCCDEAYVEERLFRNFTEVEQAEFIADDPGVDGAVTSKSMVSLERLLMEAQRSILLQSPYFILDDFFQRIFHRLGERSPSIDIRISTNSLAATDNVLAYAFALRERDRNLARFPLRIFELRPLPGSWREMIGYTRLADREIARQNESSPVIASPPHTGFHLCLHAKTYIVDADSTCIASANIDPRSVSVNSEAAVIIRDSVFTSVVKADIERDLAPENSWTIGMTEAAGDTGWFRRFGVSAGPAERSTACFELRPGGAERSCYDPDFADHYRDVGRYPQVELSLRQIEAMLLGALPESMKSVV